MARANGSKRAHGVRYKDPVKTAITFEMENVAWLDTKSEAMGGIGRSKVVNHVLERIRDLEVKVPEAYQALMAAL